MASLAAVAAASITTLGLVLDIAGAVVLARLLFIADDQAIALDQPRWASEDRQSGLQRPGVKERLRHSRRAKAAVGLLVSGFVLQIIGAWLAATR